MENGTHEQDDTVREFLKLERMLREFVRGLVSHRQDAEDVFQEATVTIINKGAKIENKARFPQWCRSVIRNEARNYWRKKGRKKLELWEDFSQVVDETYQEADVDMKMENERRNFMDLCVERLPERSRNILKMFYLEGVTSQELARRTKRSAAAIRVALTRTRDAIRRCVALVAVCPEERHGL